jgi:hypothetical protein
MVLVHLYLTNKFREAKYHEKYVFIILGMELELRLQNVAEKNI